MNLINKAYMKIKVIFSNYFNIEYGLIDVLKTTMIQNIIIKRFLRVKILTKPNQNLIQQIFLICI